MKSQTDKITQSHQHVEGDFETIEIKNGSVGSVCHKEWTDTSGSLKVHRTILNVDGHRVLAN